jgi:hypothetical protein
MACRGSARREHLPPLNSVEETLYAADFELLDRYQSFSAELLRLAMAGIAAIGFLLSVDATDFGKTIVGHVLAGTASRVGIGLSVAAFCIAAAAALAHRYLSADGMHYFIRVAKWAIYEKCEPGVMPEDCVLDRLCKDRDSQRTQFNRSTLALRIAALFLGVGAGGVGFAFLVGLCMANGAAS